MQLQNHLVSMKWYFDKAGSRRFRWIRLEKQEEGTISVRIAALVEAADGTETWQDFIIKTPFWGGNDLVNDEYELLKVYYTIRPIINCTSNMDNIGHQRPPYHSPVLPSW